jgi:branched-chain amino acid transport system substrate-binding protein
LKAKNIAIIADNSTDYGTGLAKAFKKKFAGKVVATEYYQSGDKDFNAMLTNIKNKKILNFQVKCNDDNEFLIVV